MPSLRAAGRGGSCDSCQSIPESPSACFNQPRRARVYYVIFGFGGFIFIFNQFKCIVSHGKTAFLGKN